ncbi:MAG TPA: protein kinase [Solirubrobacteraceae bacterium]|nr:protein kinase [Solirubrobacteraceae bacterium]
MPVTEHRIALPARYRVLRHIANGGMASVWAAEDELLGRLVAVKVLAPGYAQDERANRRFLREARAGARLSECRNVVTVYDIGEHDGRPFMVMEHFSGGTVADRLRTGRDIPRALALRWLREAADALDCAHRHDVVHRDVKPANLLLDERARLAVGDFGIATVATEASLTQTGQVLGTAAYISPEQARGHAATDASDRYALAVVAFELLTGRRPFTADHPAAQARAHVEDSVPSASAAGAGLPARVDRVLSAGMAKDPAQRPASAAGFLDALEDALDGEVAPAGPPTAVTARVATAPPRPPTRPVHVAPSGARRRWPGMAVLAALALVAGVAIAIAAGTGGNGTGADAGSTAKRTTTTAARTQSKPKPKPKAGAAQPQTTTQAPAQPSAQTAQTAAPGPQAKTDDPVALNDQGFALIGQGKPSDAVAPLQRSVEAFRARGRKGDIGYAYALYNLGNALRLSGRPADAIPLLEERLQVSNYKRGIVQKELSIARQQAG